MITTVQIAMLAGMPYTALRDAIINIRPQGSASSEADLSQ